MNEIKKITVPKRKRIALVAHDHKKKELMAWLEDHIEDLKPHELLGTGTTSTLIREKFGVEIKSLLSGPVGGDQQIGSRIAENKIDMLIFFWDPLEAQPHDPDVKALLRIAVLYDTVICMNPSTANFIFDSPRVHEEYEKFSVNAQQNLEERVEKLSKELP